jgi:hypothetical protein
MESEMESEDVLRARAREAIDSGKLPDRRADRTWGGPGAGEMCPVCGRLVTHDDLEMQTEFERPEGGLDKYHIHVRCFAAWEFERRRREGTGPGDAPLADKLRD